MKYSFILDYLLNQTVTVKFSGGIPNKGILTRYEGTYEVDGVSTFAPEFVKEIKFTKKGIFIYVQ